MRSTAYVVIMIVAAMQSLSAQAVWKSANGTITFTKQANADWTLPANQDRITDSVWITRANSQSLFNIRKENAYVTNAPAGTLWALGTTDSFATRVYKPFVTLSGGNPQSLVGKDLVLKLVAENIYLDIKIVSYAGGSGGGGGFSYTRAKSAPTAVAEVGAAVTSFTLLQNYPNPFNPSTTITFTLERTGTVSLTVYDIVGREVASLVNNELLSGGAVHQVQFNAGGLTSGVYLVRMQSGGKVQMKRMLLVK
jgi:hypothetical protein